jgi:hypothetical protein
MWATVTDRTREQASAFVGTIELLATSVRTYDIIFVFPVGAVRNAVTPSIQVQAFNRLVLMADEFIEATFNWV